MLFQNDVWLKAPLKYYAIISDYQSTRTDPITGKLSLTT
jgi:hypothetical protein